MTKEEVLLYFKDINSAYNNCTMYDSLSRMLDEVYQQGREDALTNLCARFKFEFDGMMERGLEDCINWSDWLNDMAEQMKEKKDEM